ncbi:MAG TPA: hypothetical protein VJ872_07945 [Nocardioides sp.]|nr:hypothetical protein [Nocardioides sp.]
MKVRRLLVPTVLGLLLAGGGLASLPGHAPVSAAAACGDGGHYALDLAGACAHEDEPPPGVDPSVPVSTSELRDREGAGPTAYAVAQDLGVAAPASVAASSPLVPCDGDGTSGYRIQAMYVVEAGSANRFSVLQSSFQLWAAGVDDVMNRSAALTGGVRHLRYVTQPGSGGCVAKVLNVTVPSGALASFNATISAIQALGYTDPTRKYLMWTDATSQCGIATLYPGDGSGQDNPNNGYYPQYARIDSGCWGFGDGATQHSVEAHELMHMLGGVQNTAPHSTHAGHCWDESDTMCYADGGNHAMVQVCTPEHEYFYDCNSDDYFTTYADPGSYLDGHWDAADSRFLIGGGDGTGGGTAGAPTILGATIAVNNPAVPGLATQASVAPSLPTGRTITAVQWKSPRTDCSFSDPTGLQTDVTCNASITSATTVTVTLTDSTGATKSVTSPLTFASGTARPVTLALGAAGQQPADGGDASVCTGAAFALRATVVDTASGAPIKGLTASFTKQTATTTAGAAGSATSTAAGVAASNQTATVATTYRARTAAGTVYAAAGPATVVAVPTTCATALTAGIDDTATYYADPVTVSGRLTAAAAGTPVAAAGVKLAVKLTPATGSAITLGTATTGADGSWSIVTKPTASGTISVGLAASAGYVAATATAGSVTVTLPDTAITGSVDVTDVGYGGTIHVSGTLRRVTATSSTPLASKLVGIYVTPAGGAPVKIGTATTTSSGTYAVAPALRVSGTLSVGFTAVPGQPAASAVVGTVTAGTWTTSTSATSSASSVVLGGTVAFTGSVTKTYAGATQPAGGVRVSVYFTATGATTPTLMTSTTTAAAGTYTVRVAPRSSGTWTVRVLDVAGYAGSSATPLPIAVN